MTTAADRRSTTTQWRRPTAATTTRATTTARTRRPRGPWRRRPWRRRPDGLMTEHRPSAKPKRWSKGRVRALAWVTGAATFLAGFGILGAAPKPSTANATDSSNRQKPPRQRIIVRKVTRRVVVVDPVVTAPVTYVPTTSGGRILHRRRHVVRRRNRPRPRRRLRHPHRPRRVRSDAGHHDLRTEARRRDAFRAMGTEVSLYGPDDDAFDEAFAAIGRVFETEERRFSRFRDDSELTAVNRLAGRWVPVSTPFERVVRLALDQASATGGLFDPTVLHAVMAAGYDRDFDEVLAGARGALASPRAVRTLERGRGAARRRPAAARGGPGPRRHREGVDRGPRRRGRSRCRSRVGAGRRRWRPRDRG